MKRSKTMFGLAAFLSMMMLTGCGSSDISSSDPTSQTSASDHTHVYDTIEWTWEGYNAATASFACSLCDDVQVIEAKVTSEITLEATCSYEGIRTYTAVVEFDGDEYTDTKERAIPATDHDIDEDTHTCQICGYKDGLEFTLSDDETSYSVTGIGSYASYFADEDGYVDLEIPATYYGLPVVSVGAQAFYSNAVIRSVTIAEGVETIESYAFADCSALTSVSIPSSVATIEEHAFYYDESCTSIDISEDSNLTTIGESAFESCTSITSFVIPDGVTEIPAKAFYVCFNLVNVTLPSNLVSIGDYSFAHCISLSAPTLPSSIESIGTGAFYYCQSFTSFTVPGSIQTISDYAFYYCNYLTSVTVSEGVTSLGDCAFCWCMSLTSISLPSTLESIGSYAFGYCTSIRTLTLNEGLVSLGSYAFYYCNSLKTITIPSTLESIGILAFQGCVSLANVRCTSGSMSFDAEENTLYIYTGTGYSVYECLATTASSKVIPDIINDAPVVGILDYAFSVCSRLTSIVLPESITSISENAFSGCSSLTTVYWSGSSYDLDYVFENATVYCYSEEEPSQEGNYWYYDDNGEPVIW